MMVLLFSIRSYIEEVITDFLSHYDYLEYMTTSNRLERSSSKKIMY